MLVVGLSPRVRGNLIKPSKEMKTVRSIPARTGEPCSGSRPWHHRKVYPRAYGGTTERLAPTLPPFGLSPRVRGNLLRVGRVSVI